MSIWSLCTRPILLGCRHTCFCGKSDSLFYESLLKEYLVNPGLAAHIHHYTEPFIPLHPPTPLVCDTKQWGSVGNFLTLICCIIDHPSPPLSFRPSKEEYPDPKFCPVLSRLIGYAVNCLYCWKFVLKPKCSFPTSFDGQNICVPLQCVKWAPLFNCADHFKSQQSNSRTLVIILNF